MILLWNKIVYSEMNFGRIFSSSRMFSRCLMNSNSNIECSRDGHYGCRGCWKTMSWCTPYTAADHLCIWQTWLSQLLPDQRDVCDLLTAACMTCHAFEKNSARERVLFFWPVRMERSPCWHPWRNLHSYLQEENENFLFLPGDWLYMTSFLCDNCNAPAFL